MIYPEPVFADENEKGDGGEQKEKEYGPQSAFKFFAYGCSNLIVLECAECLYFYEEENDV